MAIIVAIAVGIFSALPFLFSGKVAKSRRRHGKDLTIGMLVVMAVVSLAVLSLAICACSVVAPDSLIPFAIAEIAAFLGCVVVYGIWVFFGPKSRRVSEGVD